MLQASLRSRDACWDIPVPKTHAIFDDHRCPGRPASVALRHTMAALGTGYASHPQMAARDCRMPTLFPPLARKRTSGKPCGPIATGDYRPSLRSPWPAAIVIYRKSVPIDLAPSAKPCSLEVTGRCRLRFKDVGRKPASPVPKRGDPHYEQHLDRRRRCLPCPLLFR